MPLENHKAAGDLPADLVIGIDVFLLAAFAKMVCLFQDRFIDLPRTSIFFKLPGIGIQVQVVIEALAPGHPAFAGDGAAGGGGVVETVIGNT